MDINQIIERHSGYSSIHYAAEHGDEEIVDMLIDLRASVYLQARPEQGPPGRLAFKIAYDNGHEFLALTKLIPNDLNVPSAVSLNQGEKGMKTGHGGMTMVHYAVYSFDIKAVKLLLERGANPNITCSGVHPIHIAISNWDQKMIDFIYPVTDMSLVTWTPDQLTHLFNRTTSQLNWKKYFKGFFDFTVGDMPLLSYLLSAGADPNGINANRQSHLITSCLHQNAQFIQILLQYGADPNITFTCSCTTHQVNALFCILNIHCRDKGKIIPCLKVLLKANPDIPVLSNMKVKGTCIRAQVNSPSDEVNAMEAALMTLDGDIITFCVEAGFCLTGNKGRLNALDTCSHQSSPGRFPPLKPHVRYMIEAYDNTPRSLDYLAKYAVRRCLGHVNFEAELRTLPIPQMLKDYISM